MPWKASDVSELRLEFVRAVLAGTVAFSVLCRRFEVSRPTGYKWMARYQAEGATGLQNRPPVPRDPPHRLDAALGKLFVAERRKHPTWGSKKLLAVLKLQHPRRKSWPARSTVDALLKREGLVRPRRRRPRVAPHTEPLAHAQLPNDVWCIDYKGQFRLGDGSTCYPLTITDAATRYVLCCTALTSTSTDSALAALRTTFERHGLPRAMRSDNGTPFASSAPAGLSRLSVLLHRLGIVHERIAAGHPEQNGRHERFHRTLEEVCARPSRSQSRMQTRFDEFVRVFNDERPHEALDMKRPRDLYTRSARELPAHVPAALTTGADHVRSVRRDGSFKWRGHVLFLSEALAGEDVGFYELDQDIFEVRVGAIPITYLHDARGRPVLWRALTRSGSRAPSRTPVGSKV